MSGNIFRTDRVSSLQDLFLLVEGAEQSILCEPHDWHLPPAGELRQALDNNPFSNKATRPFFITKIENKRAYGYPRSTTGRQGMEHWKHPQCEPSCKITSNARKIIDGRSEEIHPRVAARVVLGVLCFTEATDLDRNTYSCHDEALAKELDSRGFAA